MKRMKLVLGAILAVALVYPAAAQVKSVDQLEYPPLPEFKIPETTRVVLDNGMVVILIEDHEMPLVDVSARFHTGSRLEPADKVGLASIAGYVMRTGGTTSMPSDELDEFLEARAAYVESGIGLTSGTAAMGCLKEDFPEVLKIFADVIRNPAFEQDKIDVFTTQKTAVIARQNDDPNDIMFREYDEILYGADSPYARTETYDTINAITRDDLIAWHGKYYHPNRMILGLSGDFDTDEVVAMVEKVFGDWVQGPAPEKAEVAYNKETPTGVFYIEKNDMTQSNVIMGHMGIVKDNPDYYAVEIVNQILSGSFASRLFANVRSKKGLAYRVRGSIGSNYDFPGDFNFYLTTKVETTAAAIDALYEEAHNLTKLPPSEEEVGKAKSSILNSFVFNSDSMRKILNQQLTYEYFGYPLDWLERYAEGIESATVEEVQAAAAKYVHPDRFAILVVGPSEGQDRPLAEFGEVAMVDITIPEPTEEEVVASAEDLARGSELMAKAVDASGGSSTIGAVETLETAGTLVIKTPQGEMPMKVKFQFGYPDRLRQELVTPMGTMTMICTADGGVVQSAQGTKPMPDSMQKDMQKSARRELVALLKASGSEGFTAAVTGDAEVDGTQVVLVTIQQDGVTTTVGIAPETGRVLSMAYTGTFGMSQSPGQVEHTFADFREVDGIKYPFAHTVTMDGDPAGSFTVESLTINGLDDAVFAMAGGEGGGQGGR